MTCKQLDLFPENEDNQYGFYRKHLLMLSNFLTDNEVNRENFTAELAKEKVKNCIGSTGFTMCIELHEKEILNLLK